MTTHTFARTPQPTLVAAHCALADLLDPLREMVAVGDLSGGLYAELAQIEAQMAAAVERRHTTSRRIRAR